MKYRAILHDPYSTLFSFYVPYLQSKMAVTRVMFNGISVPCGDDICFQI